jgi:flagellar hook-associated protein 2
MTSINFTGLASGMDTNLIIENLMELERLPLKRLEDDKQFYQSRLSSLKTYHDKLSALNTSVDALSLSGNVRETQVSLSNSDYFSANISGAQEGTYSVTVEKLAQVQKSVSETAFASRTSMVFGTGELNLTIGETSHTFSITENNNSLDSIMNTINEEVNTHGISASIIDNGNEGGNRYYLVLTGADSSMEFTLDSTGLAGGTETLSVAVTQTAQNAVAYIDGIQVTGKTNTIENAIHGVTLSLENVSPDNGSGGLTPTTMTISLNKNSVAGKIENFVKAYNDMVTFVAEETKVIGSGGGLLTGDSMVSTAMRRLQNMLGKQVEGTETYSALTQLGLTTSKDGTISFDNGKLTKAVEENFDDVTTLMAGDDGIFKQYRNYLTNLLGSSSGLYATRQQNVQRITDRIDKDIERMEARLEKREQILTKRFSAMENLVSVLNAQSDYIKQQMDMLSNMGGKKR